MNSNAQRTHLAPTLFELVADRLKKLCNATGLGEDTEQVRDLFRRIASPWLDEAFTPTPPWPSLIGDDHTPFEFSVGFGDASQELRIMVEPLGAIPSVRSNQEASLSLLKSLAQDYDLDLRRLEKIQSLFLPSHPSGTFAIWVAVGFTKGRPPAFKIYLDPEAQGRENAPGVVEEMMATLGFRSAGNAIAKSLTPRGPELDELKYVSLDLAPSSKARIKVYARHQRCTVKDLEHAASASPSHRRGDVARFIEIMAPQVTKAFKERSPITCFSFVQGRGDGPSSATTHLPINSYAPHDGEIEQRVLALLDWLELPRAPYTRTLRAYATRRLDRGIGLQAYVSFRRDVGKARLTVYLPAEIYAPGTVAKPTLLSSRTSRKAPPRRAARL